MTGSPHTDVLETYESINTSKVNLDHVYNQPDPRAYFRELGKLAYDIPGAAKPVFQSLIDCLRTDGTDNTVHALDIGCSYGVNAALLKHDLTLSDLYRHWGNPELTGATPAEVVEHDRAFFDSLKDSGELTVLGLDQADNAISFAAEVGILDGGVIANLENQPLPSEANAPLSRVDLVMSTGCVGYVTQKSFETLLPVVSEGHRPWFANFVLRMFPFDDIAETLANEGYVTEKLEGRTFVQRRFASVEERDHVLEQVASRGLDVDGKESTGHLHAEFYLSRPAAAAAAQPLDQILAA